MMMCASAVLLRVVPSITVPVAHHAATDGDPVHPSALLCFLLPAKCMSPDNRCSKDFPKEFIAFTAENENGYPLYRRRKPSDGGQEVEYRMPGGGVEMVDNSWVVPYNSYLLLMCASHHIRNAAAGLSRRQ
jgi:hypothetical protein